MGRFQVPVDQIVSLFRASTWWTADLDVESRCGGVLTDPVGPVRARVG